MEEQITIDLLNEQTGIVEPRQVDFSGNPPQCLLQLRGVPGSRAVQVRVRSASGVILLAEVPAPAGELTVRLWRTPDCALRLECGAGPITFLEPSAEVGPVFLPHQTGKFDIHFLLDATTLHPSADSPDQLASLFLQNEWTTLSEQLAGIPTQLAAASQADTRTAVTAFGDFDSYLLHPADAESRALRSLNAGELLQELRRIPPVAEGDYVDALAEGLESCLHAGWREDARKLVILLGDSPGYSVLDDQSSVMQLANIQFRPLDVFEQAAQLHRSGIEIVSIFHEPSANVLKDVHAAAGELTRQTRKQYQRLASLQEWAFSTDSLRSSRILDSWAPICHPLGRGACPGFIS